MKALARRDPKATFTHRVEIRDHHLVVDEPDEKGGDDEGATPMELFAASLASCTAITVEMYAKRKGWDVGPLEVECEYELPEPGHPTNFKLTLRLPGGCSEEQLERLRAIAAKCPIHRILEGEVTFEEHLEAADSAAA
jgi:putative redox protein